MRPGFALSLSFEGISLLHRAAGGWRSVGEVALDVPDLAAALSELRDKALRLEPEGFSCKLIIPNDQIRYLTLDTGRSEGEARRARVREALDGATPYAVDDLAFDISVEGHKTHVAAVARETLAEAESFALEHRFNPVSFVAVPGDQPFLGEPFFGVAEAAGTAQVEPDGIAVVVTGPARIPDPQNATETAQQADAPPEAPGETTQETVDSPETTESRAEDAAPADTGPAVDDAPSETGGGQETGDAVPPAVGFSSRRGKDDGAAPRLDGASRDAPSDGGRPAPQVTATPDDLPPTASPGPALAAPADRAADAAAPPVPRPVPGPDTPEPSGKPARGPSVRARAGGFLSRRKAGKPATGPGKEKARKGKPAKALPGTGQPGAQPVAPPPQSAQVATAPDTGAPPRDEAERMTVFGARQAQRVGGKPRHLGLILTLVLLLFLAAVAAWAALFTDDGIARLFAPGDREEIAAEPQPAADAADAPDATVDTGADTALDEATADDAPGTAPAPAQPPLTSALPPQPPGTLADLAPGATDGASDTAPQSAVPQSPRLSDTDSAVLDALREDSGVETDVPAPPDAPLAEDTAAIDPELAPEPEPEAEVAADLADADTETFYAATGIWPEAPDEPDTPAIIGLDDIYVASIDRTDLSQDAVALPQPRGYDTDAALNAVTSPAAAGTAFDLDDRGLVTPTPEGAVTPDGITVYLGPPPVVPPPTPDRQSPAEAAGAEAAALRERLAGFRPRPRPTDLVEQTERSQLGGRSRVELGQLRPRARPASAQDDAAVSGAPATAQAVASALVPKPRPRDFETIVRNSDRASIGIPETLAAAAPAAATVAPSIPSSASVARQATLKNEINLRRLNLIGVYGTAANRRALVRLPSGRYKKVQVGDRIDGGNVVAIGEDQLRYQKGGQNHTLTMPKG